MVETADIIWSDGPAGSPFHPPKPKIRAWGKWIEGVIAAFLGNSGLVYASRAALYADLAHPANSSAWVIGDATVAYNGVYVKSGASGTGAWARVSDLPFSFIVANDAGAGTPNAIQATTSIPVSASALIWLTIADTNTGSPVTVQFNGGAILTVKTNAGNNVAAGGLVAGVTVMGIVSGSTFRLVSDQASAAIVAAAEAAQAAAEASLANSLTIVSSASALPAMTVNNGINFLRTNGYSAATGKGASGYRLMGSGEADVYGQLLSNSGAKRWAPDTSDLWENTRRYGITMDGNNADTGRFADMLTGLGSKAYFLPEGQLNINDELPDIAEGGLRIIGAGRDKTKIKTTASGVARMMRAVSGGGPISFENLTLDVTGYSTRAFETPPFVPGQSFGLLRMQNISLLGDQPGDLVHLGLFGDWFIFENIEMLLGNNGTIGLTFDTGPHNILINGLVAFGPGTVGAGGMPIRVAQTFDYAAYAAAHPSDGVTATTHRVEWLRVDGLVNLASGPKVAEIGPSLGTCFVAPCLDQFTNVGIHYTGNAGSGADIARIYGGYVGSNGITGVLIDEFSGSGVKIDGLAGNNLDYVVDIRATASRRTARHKIKVEGRNIRKSIVRNDSSDSVIEVNELFPQGMTEGSIHLLDTNGGKAQSIINNSNPSSFARDAGVPVPKGKGNAGALAWLDYKSVSLGLSAPMGIASGGSPTDVIWSAEDYDPMNCHVANTPGIVIQDGMNICEFSFLTLWDANNSGNRVAQLCVNVSGTTTVVLPLERQAFGTSSLGAARQFAVAPGQIWFLRAYQDGTGGILNLTAGSYLQMKVTG